ncbi:hypothetical protein HK405_013172, partial [Cladochytrium tenue]
MADIAETTVADELDALADWRAAAAAARRRAANAATAASRSPTVTARIILPRQDDPLADLPAIKFRKTTHTASAAAAPDLVLAIGAAACAAIPAPADTRLLTAVGLFPHSTPDRAPWTPDAPTPPAAAFAAWPRPPPAGPPPTVLLAHLPLPDTRRAGATSARPASPRALAAWAQSVVDGFGPARVWIISSVPTASAAARGYLDDYAFTAPCRVVANAAFGT